MKATSSRWIDHKIRAMGRVVEKFGLYNQHLQNVISVTANAKARVTLEGKYRAYSRKIKRPGIGCFFKGTLFERHYFS